MNEIFLKKMSATHFKKFDSIEFPIQEKIILLGKNGAGKSSVLDAIAWAITGKNLYGCQCDSMKKGANFSSVNLKAETENGDYTIERSLGIKNGKTKHMIFTPFPSVYVDPDPAIFFSIANPRYILNNINNLKTVLSKIYSCVPMSTIEKNMDQSVVDYIHDHDLVSSTTVNNAIEEIAQQQKKIKKDYISEQESEKLYRLFNKSFGNIKFETEDDSTKVKDMISFYTKEIEKSHDLAVRFKEQIDVLELYKKEIISVIANDFNGYLKDVKIVTEENGKDVFEIFYKDMNVKVISSAQQTLAGIELSNAIAHKSKKSYPLLIDNAESIIRINFDDYPYIKQVIACIATCDNDLSIWSDGKVTNVKTLVSLPRSLENIRPTIHILNGWGM